MGFRVVQNAITLNSFVKFQQTKVLILILGLSLCLGIGVFLALEQYVFVFGLFAIFLAFVVIMFPHVGLLFFIGLTYIRPQDYIPGIVGKPIVLMLMTLTFGSFLIRIISLKQREFVNAPQNYLMLGLLTVVMLSTIRVNWLIYTKDSFIDFLKIVLLYILTVQLIDTHQKFGVFFWSVLALTTYIAALGILQYYGIDITGVEIGGAGGRGDIGRIRGVGIFNSPNYLAYCVIFMLPAAAYLLYHCRFFIGRLLAFAVFGILMYCVYLTRSRGGYLCAALVLGFLFFHDRSPKVKLMGAFVTLSAAFILTKVVSFMGSVANYQEDGSAMGRVEAWGAGFQMLRGAPLFGIGYGNWHNFHFRSAHNSFVEIGAELGIIGLFIWIGLLYWSYKYLRAIIQNNSYVNTRWPIIYSKSLAATLSAYAIGSCFTTLGHFILLYIFVALIASAGQVYIAKEKLEKLNRIHGKDLWIVGSIEMLILVIWRVFPAL